jgi:hypothetical protein
MLQGTADVEALGASAPSLELPASEALEVRHVDLMQVAYEVRADDRDALLPPALHPVNPPVATFSFLRAASSDHGPFTLAEMRLLCRSGLRTRGYLIGSFIDNDDMAAALAAGWGYRISVADVSLERRYDSTAGRVTVDGREVLVAGHVSPVPLSPDDLQYTATMNLARLDRGLRLVQVERDYQFTRAERGTPFVHAFDADVWGEPRLRLSHPASASSAIADVTLKPVRFVCRPDVWAFEGTEAVRG